MPSPEETARSFEDLPALLARTRKPEMGLPQFVSTFFPAEKKEAAPRGRSRAARGQPDYSYGAPQRDREQKDPPNTSTDDYWPVQRVHLEVTALDFHDKALTVTARTEQGQNYALRFRCVKLGNLTRVEREEGDAAVTASLARYVGGRLTLHRVTGAIGPGGQEMLQDKGHHWATLRRPVVPPEPQGREDITPDPLAPIAMDEAAFFETAPARGPLTGGGGHHWTYRAEPEAARPQRRPRGDGAVFWHGQNPKVAGAYCTVRRLET